MKTYAAFGFKEFIICLGYKGEMIKDYFRNYLWMASDVTLTLGREPTVLFHTGHEEEDWLVTLAETGEETLTAGRLSRIRSYLNHDETFLFTYGDGVGNINILETIKFHRAHGRIVTLTAVHPPGRFGELGLGSGGEVLEFNEKPQAEGGWINGGFFVASAKIFDYLQNSDQIMFEQGPIRRLASENQLRAFKHTGFWQPMDTYQEYLMLNRLWNEGKAPWKIW